MEFSGISPKEGKQQMDKTTKAKTGKMLVAGVATAAALAVVVAKVLNRAAREADRRDPTRRATGGAVGAIQDLHK